MEEKNSWCCGGCSHVFLMGIYGGSTELLSVLQGRQPSKFLNDLVSLTEYLWDFGDKFGFK